MWTPSGLRCGGSKDGDRRHKSRGPWFSATTIPSSADRQPVRSVPGFLRSEWRSPGGRNHGGRGRGAGAVGFKSRAGAIRLGAVPEGLRVGMSAEFTAECGRRKTLSHNP
jgi:hypothetical protein